VRGGSRTRLPPHVALLLDYRLLARYGLYKSQNEYSQIFNIFNAGHPGFDHPDLSH